MNRVDMAAACGKKACKEAASHYQGHQLLCPMHYRFGQMRAHAKRHGKFVPTEFQLAHMVHPEMKCADCSTQMNWLARDSQARVATLQHYRDGSYALVCRSCNTRHAMMAGDSYRDMPKDHRRCPHCGVVKPFSGFVKDASRSGPMKLKSWCKQCSSEAHREWRETRTS